MANWEYICSSCKESYSHKYVFFKCKCGGFLNINFNTKNEYIFDINQQGIWKYKSLLPKMQAENLLSLGEGNTPLLKEEFNEKNVLIKAEQLSPTGSYKDRGFALLINHIKNLGVKNIIEDSSGNAAVSASAYACRAGIECRIYVPSVTSKSKIVQVSLFEAELNILDMDRDAVSKHIQKDAEITFYASHVWNPLFFEGIKTFAYEIYEQTNGNIPDTLILPLGNGSLVIGSFLGFQDLLKLNLISKIPRIIGVQAENCNPIYRNFKSKEVLPEPMPTLAEGIAIAKPLRINQIIEYIHNTAGDIITVSEEEIMYALKVVLQKGHIIEPTSAATIAGLFKYLGNKKADERVLSVYSGNGLKTLDKIQQLINC